MSHYKRNQQSQNTIIRLQKYLSKSDMQNIGKITFRHAIPGKLMAANTSNDSYK